MPIPAGAGVLAAVVHFEGGSPVHDLWASMVWLGLVAFTGFLMVSSWRFWSGKEIDMGARKPGRFLVLLVVIIGVVRVVEGRAAGAGVGISAIRCDGAPGLLMEAALLYSVSYTIP
jgi:phosphatidylserine synthase